MADPITVRGAIEQSGLVPADARALLVHVVRRDRAWLVAHATDPLERAHADAFFALAKRRRDGEPVAYLVGVREFWGLPLRVSPAVLIPRPETETLVEAALARLPANASVRVADLGTGSGAIALAVARERPRAHVIATDVSDEALAIARDNAARLRVDNVEFVRADWYAGLPDGRFDAILSNPPYVAPRDPHLEQGDLRFEPRMALIPGHEALTALKTILRGAPARLNAGGHVVVEHGYDQAGDVSALFVDNGFVDVQAFRDLAGIARVAAGRLR